MGSKERMVVLKERRKVGKVGKKNPGNGLNRCRDD
jgi:hypothetical protein